MRDTVKFADVRRDSIAKGKVSQSRSFCLLDAKQKSVRNSDGNQVRSRNPNHLTAPRSVAATPYSDVLIASHSFSKASAESVRCCSMIVRENPLAGDFEQPAQSSRSASGVFNRSPGYNSGEDTIVRGTARHLRQRLEQYYADEGQGERLRISVPKGGYVAHFETASTWIEPQPNPLTHHAAPEPFPQPTSEPASKRWPLSARITISLLTAAAILLPLAVYLWTRPSLPTTASHGPQLLWHALFTPERKTLIVPGDASLDAYIAWEQHPVSLENYANQTYQQNASVSRPPSGLDVPLSTRSVTPMADLRLIF